MEKSCDNEIFCEICFQFINSLSYKLHTFQCEVIKKNEQYLKKNFKNENYSNSDKENIENVDFYYCEICDDLLSNEVKNEHLDFHKTEYLNDSNSGNKYNIIKVKIDSKILR